MRLFAKRILARAPQHGLSREADAALGAALGFAEAVLIASAAIVILHTYASGSTAARPPEMTGRRVAQRVAVGARTRCARGGEG